MERVHQLVALLESTLADPSRLATAVLEFQSTVWNSSSDALRASAKIEDVLRTLAYDLDFYVPDPVTRAEDSSYYGEERAIKEIQHALATLRALGAA